MSKYYYFTYQFVDDTAYKNGFGSCTCKTEGVFFIDHWRAYIDKKNDVQCVITNFIEITKEQFDEYLDKEAVG